MPRFMEQAESDTGPVNNALMALVQASVAEIRGEPCNRFAGIDIEPHMARYRADSLATELVCTTGTVDDMLVPGDIEPGDDEDDD